MQECDKLTAEQSTLFKSLPPFRGEKSLGTRPHIQQIFFTSHQKKLKQIPYKSRVVWSSSNDNLSFSFFFFFFFPSRFVSFVRVIRPRVIRWSMTSWVPTLSADSNSVLDRAGARGPSVARAHRRVQDRSTLTRPCLLWNGVAPREDRSARSPRRIFSSSSAWISRYR